MEYTITTPEMVFSFSEDEINSKYLKDTLIEKIFLNNNFLKTTNLDLDFSINAIEYLKLIIDGKLKIPEFNDKNEFSNLLDFLAYKNESFYKYSKIVKADLIMDCFGKICSIDGIIPFDMLELIYEYSVSDSINLSDNIKKYVFDKYQIKYYNNPRIDYCPYDFFSSSHIIKQDGLCIFFNIQMTYYDSYGTCFYKRYSEKKLEYTITKIKDIFDIIDNLQFDNNENYFQKETKLVLY